MPKKDLTVSLDDFLKFLLKKWAIILGVIVVFVGICGVSAKMLGEKIVIEPSEEYLSLKEEEASLNDYITNAPLMKIDATCVKEIDVYISNISERDGLKNYVISGDIWDGFKNPNIFYDIDELVLWEDGNNISLAEIKIQYYDIEECEYMARFFKDRIQKFDKSAKVFVGTPCIATNKSIAETQIWYRNRISAIEGQLEYARAGYVIEASLPVAAVAGVLFGGIVSVVGMFVWFYVEQKRSLLVR